MKTFRWLCLLLVPLACSQPGEVELASEDGSVTLLLPCSAPADGERTSEQVTLVRQHAGRIRRFEVEEGREDRLLAIDRAIQQLNDAELEAAVAAYTCQYGFPVRRPPRFPEPGSTPPDFLLTALDRDDQIVRLSDLRDRVILLNFWAAWCAPCRDEYGELVEVARSYADSGLVVLTVLYRDTPASARAWIAERGGGVPFFIDPGESTARSYGIRGIPRVFVIGRDGKIAGAMSGFVEGKVARLVGDALAAPSDRGAGEG